MDAFGIGKSSFKFLHSVLVEKNIVSSYVSNLDELIAKFQQYDTNGSGKISIENFEKFCTKSSS